RGAHRDLSAFQQRGRSPDINRANADRGNVVAGREEATILDEPVIQLRSQQGMVDRLRDRPLAERLNGQGDRGHRQYGRRMSRAMRKPRFTSSSDPSNARSSCSMMQSPA